MLQGLEDLPTKEKHSYGQQGVFAYPGLLCILEDATVLILNPQSKATRGL